MEAESWAAEVELRETREVEWLATGSRMVGHRRQNAGPPEVEWLATGAEYRDTGAECWPPEQSTGTQKQNAGQREQNRRIWKEKSAQLWGLRAFTICFAARATLRKGPTCRRANLPDAAKGRAGRGRGGG